MDHSPGGWHGMCNTFHFPYLLIQACLRTFSVLTRTVLRLGTVQIRERRRFSSRVTTLKNWSENMENFQREREERIFNTKKCSLEMFWKISFLDLNLIHSSILKSGLNQTKYESHTFLSFSVFLSLSLSLSKKKGGWEIRSMTPSSSFLILFHPHQFITLPFTLLLFTKDTQKYFKKFILMSKFEGRNRGREKLSERERGRERESCKFDRKRSFQLFMECAV